MYFLGGLRDDSHVIACAKCQRRGGAEAEAGGGAIQTQRAKTSYEPAAKRECVSEPLLESTNIAIEQPLLSVRLV